VQVKQHVQDEMDGAPKGFFSLPTFGVSGEE